MQSAQLLTPRWNCHIDAFGNQNLGITLFFKAHFSFCESFFNGPPGHVDQPTSIFALFFGERSEGFAGRGDKSVIT